MTDMVERVALALLNDDRMAAGWPAVSSRDGIPDSEGYVRNARAAIEAMREPTDAMLSIGYNAFDGGHGAAAIWPVMIAAALIPTIDVGVQGISNTGER